MNLSEFTQMRASSSTGQQDVLRCIEIGWKDSEIVDRFICDCFFFELLHLFIYIFMFFSLFCLCLHVICWCVHTQKIWKTIFIASDSTSVTSGGGSASCTTPTFTNAADFHSLPDDVANYDLQALETSQSFGKILHSAFSFVV